MTRLTCNRAAPRFVATVTLPILLLLLTLFFRTAPAGAAPLTYARNLDAALNLMERGKQPQALVPLRDALTADRDGFYGRVALGTLYLQSNSPALAAREFERAQAAAPDDVLGAWGAALVALAQGKADARLFAPFANRMDLPDAPRRIAPLLALYAALVRGDAAGARQATLTVNAAETDTLRLELAAFAALRGGDPDRGAELLDALLKRPAMRTLAEDPALELTFDLAHPAEGEAAPLPAPLALPEAPTVAAATLSGRVTLTPPADALAGAAYVTYSLDGGAFSATTNAAPFTQDWNTARIPSGTYTLRTDVFDADRRLLREVTRPVRLANADAPDAPSRLTDAQAAGLRARLWALLQPHPCRKAAHYALAERAVAVGDSATALAETEAVCAIDPDFRGAYQTLRRFYHDVLGPRDGIWQARTPDKIVALTFDDGPNPLPQRTPALLDALRGADAPATFFVVGWRAEQSPDLLKRMADEGHEIGNHTYSHLNLTFLKESEVERELCRTSVIVREATGRRPRFYRPPGGNFNHAVVQAAEALGMSGAYWTVDGVKIEEDPASTPGQLTDFVLSRVRPGAIILLHNAPTVTVAALPEIVRGLRAKGYTLVTMTDLVQRARKDPLPTAPAVAVGPSSRR